MANVEEACARFERLGVPFKERLMDGKMKNIALILDLDGYWIEVVLCFFLTSSRPAMCPPRAPNFTSIFCSLVLPAAASQVNQPRNFEESEVDRM